MLLFYASLLCDTFMSRSLLVLRPLTVLHAWLIILFHIFIQFLMSKIKMNQHSRVVVDIVASEIAKLSSIQPKLISIQIIGDVNKTCQANGE